MLDKKYFCNYSKGHNKGEEKEVGFHVYLH